MVVSVPLWLLITLTTSPLWLAGCVLVLWRAVSPSTRPSKRPTTPTSATPSELASLQADVASLFSTLEKLTTTVRRLSSRQGMRDLREREAGPPPIGTPKSELRKYYGVNGMSGPQQAEFQQLREGS